MWEILLLSLKLGDTPVFMTACLPYTGLSVSQGTPKVNAKTLRYQTGKNVIFSYSSLCLLEQEKEPGGVARQCGYVSGASSLVSLLHLYGQRSSRIWIWMVVWP